MTYYHRLLELCQYRGITVEQISEGTGISLYHFRQWGRRHFSPDFDSIMKVAEYLNVSLEYFSWESVQNIKTDSRTKN